MRSVRGCSPTGSASSSRRPGYRLAGTIGYWNGLGIFAVIGLFLALGFAARGGRLATRAIAAAALPILAATMYLTFSRGAWLALVAGFAAALRRRSPPAAARVRRVPSSGCSRALGVLLASGADGLTRAAHHSPPLPGAATEFALVLIAPRDSLRQSPRPSSGWLNGVFVCRSSLRLAWAAALVACVLVGASVVWQREGSPVHLAQRAWDKAQPLLRRLATTHGSSTFRRTGASGLWQVAWDTFSDHRVVGVGGGTYWQEWVASWRGFFPSTEAHSVYAETLAELGIIGLVLLLLVLVPPVWVPCVRGARRSCRSRSRPSSAGLVHAGVDWDWELMGVSGAALICGVALVAAGRGDPRALASAWRAAAQSFSPWCYCCSRRPACSRTRGSTAPEAALGRGDLSGAVAGRRSARRFAPWSIAGRSS